jgi:hypothetical protein
MAPWNQRHSLMREPVVTHERLNTDECSECRPNEVDQTAKDGYRASDNVRQSGAAKHRAEPHDPVLRRILAQVLRVSQTSDKEVLCRELLSAVRECDVRQMRTCVYITVVAPRPGMARP